MKMKSKNWLFILLIITGLTTACQKKVSVLVITGGHAFDTTEFFETFHALDGMVCESISQPSAMKLLASDRVMDYDVLVFYDFIPDMELKDSSIFLNLTNKGQAMLFLHHSLCTFQKWEGFMHMVGGRYQMPEFVEDSLLWSDYEHDIELDVQVTDPLHPVTEGIGAFTIMDEGYSNVSYMPGITPLLKTDHSACSPVIGWVNSSDRSTIVYLMLGHDRHAYSNEAFQQLLVNSITWLSTKHYP
jgi:hypothetical protein